MTLEEKRIYNRAWYNKNKERLAAKRKPKVLTPEQRAKARKRAKERRLAAQYDPRLFVAYLFESCKYGALDRKIPFHITKEDVTRMCIESNGKCALSGLPLSSEYNNPMKASIDRIDSSKGYTVKNVQLVGSMVNKAKNDLTTELFVILCKGVVDTCK